MTSKERREKNRRHRKIRQTNRKRQPHGRRGR